MATGRCEGCGRTGSACKIRDHVIQCGDWLALPFDHQLDPERSYRQWKAEGKQEARVEHKAELAGREIRLRAMADARWVAPRDILED